MSNYKKWICPACGHMVADAVKKQAAHDYPCPRCGRNCLSFFVRYTPKRALAARKVALMFGYGLDASRQGTYTEGR